MSEETRKSIIENVTRTILGERQDTYGSPENSFQLIANYWSLYLGMAISSVQVADMMELLKIARRQNQSFHLDNYIDSAGYAILAGELAFEQQQVDGEG